MNLLCPNCQKPLTVPEQYAGQPMRCPLCAGTFTVPALPPTGAAPPPPPPPPPPSPPSPPSETYGFKDPVAPPPPPPSPPPVLNFETSPAVKPPSPITSAPPPGPPPSLAEEQPTFPSTPTPEGYHRKYTIWFSPKVLQYVAPAALLLVFVLTFFPWVGYYPGGVGAVWQSAWGYGADDDTVTAASAVLGNVPHLPPFPLPADLGWNFLLIIYLVLLIPTLVVTVGCLVLAFLHPSKLPPALYPLLPWRWGVVAALNLVLLLFLILQLIFGFSLENNYINATNSAVGEVAKTRATTTTPEARKDAVIEGLARQTLRRTTGLDFVVVFQVLAVLGAALMFCLNRRGTRPAPRIDMLW